MAKVIFHIDLNAFFANAEIVRNHSLEGQPVVVGGLSKRSVVCTASYEARKYGVKSAMPLFKALELCPHLLVIKGDHSWYEELSERFFKFLKDYSPYIEIASIDECYLDVSEVIKKYPRPLDLAWDIQSSLKEVLGLSCSIGVAPNKFLAKMASDMRKPMGITVLRKAEIKKKLWPLSIDEMFGIGKKTAKLLKAQGIDKIADLANPDNEMYLLKTLGKQGSAIVQNARGNGSDTLVYNSNIQSLSQSMTIDHDVENYEEMKTILKNLIKKLSQRAMEQNILGKMVTISIRYHDFRNIVRSINLDYDTNDIHSIYENALLLLDQNYEEIPIRHLGVGIANLNNQRKEMEQMNMFMKPKTKIDVLNELNKNVHGTPLIYASSLMKKDRN